MDSKKLICIACPLGCGMEIAKSNNDYAVYGNKCNRGEEYAIEEISNPTRIVTSTVKINNSKLRRLPVRTDKAIPKDKIFHCMNLIDAIEVEAPIAMNKVIIANILGTGVNLVASRSIKE